MRTKSAIAYLYGSTANHKVRRCEVKGCKLGKWDLFCEVRPKCVPFHQFGSHADEVHNCGPFPMHCKRTPRMSFPFRLQQLPVRLHRGKFRRPRPTQGVAKPIKLQHLLSILYCSYRVHLLAIYRQRDLNYRRERAIATCKPCLCSNETLKCEEQEVTLFLWGNSECWYPF